MSEPSQSTPPNVIPEINLERATPPKTPVSANTQFSDIFSRLDQHQRNASKPIKASVKAASEQPSVAQLASLGIKVRDFAYESKLPPIQPIYRHPRQIQPAVVRTTLKRQWAESEEDDFFSQSGSQPESSQKKLERTSTEPAIPPAPDIDDYDTESQDPNKYPESQQMPLSIFESQESEPYVDTPLVTPKGSLQWRVEDTSNIPASQLDAAESQSTALEPAPHFASFFPKLPMTPTSPLASALSLASINDLSNSPSYGKTNTGPDQQPEDPDCAPTMRYHLRRRPVAPSSPLPAKPPSRLRPRGAVIPPSTSIQSSQSQEKPKNSRTLRRATSGQEKRRRTS